MSETKSDLPDTPQEVLDRQAIARPLTAATAELLGQKEYIDDAGNLIGFKRTVIDDARRKARVAAEEFMGGTPLMGLSEDAVKAVKNKVYPGAPAMGPTGDRTPAFVDWLWNMHPNDAAKRYAYRNIWPSVFCPPKAAGGTAIVPPSNAPKARRKRGPNKPKGLKALEGATLTVVTV